MEKKRDYFSETFKFERGLNGKKRLISLKLKFLPFCVVSAPIYGYFMGFSETRLLYISEVTRQCRLSCLSLGVLCSVRYFSALISIKGAFW